MDFQSGVIQPYFAQGSSGLRALFHVYIVNEKIIEDAECFYMTLHSPQNGGNYDPEIRAWTPSRAIGWIESETNSTLVNESLIHFTYNMYHILISVNA